MTMPRYIASSSFYFVSTDSNSALCNPQNEFTLMISLDSPTNILITYVLAPMGNSESRYYRICLLLILLQFQNKYMVAINT